MIQTLQLQVFVDPPFITIIFTSNIKTSMCLVGIDIFTIVMIMEPQAEHIFIYYAYEMLCNRLFTQWISISTEMQLPDIYK